METSLHPDLFSHQPFDLPWAILLFSASVSSSVKGISICLVGWLEDVMEQFIQGLRIVLAYPCLCSTESHPAPTYSPPLWGLSPHEQVTFSQTQSSY